MTSPLVCSECGEKVDGGVGTTRERHGKPYCLKCYAILPSDRVAPTSLGNPAAGFAILMMLLGAGLGAYGAYLAFHDPGETGKIVGGDAYNYQIYAARGLVIAAGGIIAVLLGLTAATLGNYRSR